MYIQYVLCPPNFIVKFNSNSSGSVGFHGSSLRFSFEIQHWDLLLKRNRWVCSWWWCREFSWATLIPCSSSLLLSSLWSWSLLSPLCSANQCSRFSYRKQTLMSLFKIIVDFLNYLSFKFAIAKTRFLSFIATNYMFTT